MLSDRARRAALRAKAEALLLETMDSPALYTVIGGLKPMASSFLSSLSSNQVGALSYAKSELQPGGAVLAKIDELRRTMVVLRCGDDIQSAVLTEIDMSTGSADQGAIEPFVFHVPAIRNVIAEFPSILPASRLRRRPRPRRCSSRCIGLTRRRRPSSRRGASGCAPRVRAHRSDPCERRSVRVPASSGRSLRRVRPPHRARRDAARTRTSGHGDDHAHPVVQGETTGIAKPPPMTRLKMLRCG